MKNFSYVLAALATIAIAAPAVAQDKPMMHHHQHHHFHHHDMVKKPMMDKKM
jgi:hypothetical protein